LLNDVTRWLVWAVTVSALSPDTARAYRPFDSTDADVAALREAELELGFGYLEDAGARDVVIPQLVVNLGVFERVELVLQGTGLLRLNGGSSALGLDDTGFFVKAVLRQGTLQGHTGPSVATELGVLLPTVHGEAGVGASAAMIVSQRWVAAAVHLNLEVRRTRAGSAAGFGGLIVEGPGAWAVRPVAEVHLDPEAGAAMATSGLLGLIWRVADALSLDVAVRASRRGAETAREARLGLTWGFTAWGPHSPPTLEAASPPPRPGGPA